MRVLPASFLLLLALGASAFAEPGERGIGCAKGVCAVVDGSGKVQFLDMSNNTITPTGGTRLAVSQPGPVSVSCTTVANQPRCAAIDAGGKVWWIDPRGAGNVMAGPTLQ